MKVIADTLSLLQFVRYYLPFDREGILRSFIVERVSMNDLIVLDSVWKECGYVAQGMVSKLLPELASRLLRSDSIQPPSARKLSNMIDENFAIQQLKRDLLEEEYWAAKQEFMKTADYSILVCALYNQHNSDLFGELHVLTEETRLPNDGKLFRKIPDMMTMINVPIYNISDYLKSYSIDADWFINQ